MKPDSNLKTVGDFIRWAASEFARKDVYLGHGSDSYWDEAVFLIMGALKLDINSDNWLMQCHLTDEEITIMNNALVDRIEKRIPVPYILGEAWFCGLLFKINQNCLIPRSPIAELIQQQFQPWLVGYPDNILDLCTGSGCIGIAVAMEFTESSVDLIDISPEALEIAQQNIDQFELGYRVRALESDLLSAIVPEQQYQLIVSNPPYVDQEDFNEMPEEYKHEPELGLVSGNDGLDACRRILKEAAGYLSDDGILIVEVGNSGDALMDAYPDVEFTWLEFEMGGQGVFMLTREQLIAKSW